MHPTIEAFKMLNQKWRSLSSPQQKVWAAVFTVGVLVVSGCQPQQSGRAKVAKLTADTQKATEQTKTALPKLEVLEQSTVYEDGATYIVGTARVNQSVSYAKLEFGVLDKNGKRIGTALDNITNLAAGTTWKFNALILQKEAAKVTRPEIYTRD